MVCKRDSGGECTKWRIWPKLDGGRDSAANCRRWSRAGDLTVIRRKRTVSQICHGCSSTAGLPVCPDFSLLLQEISASVSVWMGNPSICCCGWWYQALTELRLLINGSAVSQNLVIGDCLSQLFFFFQSSSWSLSSALQHIHVTVKPGATYSPE